MVSRQWNERATPFLAEVCDWISQQGEVFAEIYYRRTAGVHDYLFIHACTYFQELLATLPLDAAITVYREKQLPLRGLADAQLLEQALALVPDGQEWFLLCAADAAALETDGQRDFWWAGQRGQAPPGIAAWGAASHQALRDEWPAVSGRYIAFGPDFPAQHQNMPNIQARAIHTLIAE